MLKVSYPTTLTKWLISGRDYISGVNKSYPGINLPLREEKKIHE